MTAVINASATITGAPSRLIPPALGGFPDHDRLADLVTRMRAGDREAAADFMVQYGPLLRRRVRGKLGAAMRRLFDSQEILSTVGRRLDRYVRVGGLEAESPGQLLQLVFRMAESAVIDKIRVFKRLERIEGEDSQFAQELGSRLHDADQGQDDGAVISLDGALRALSNDTDRQILTMWLNGTQHNVIAWDLGMTPAAVRQRWKTIRDRLKESLRLGAI
jgi:DNA-directed RNA polymerase specialized sigma24 family protein